MKLLIIGASGKTGEALVEQALAAGHQVTAFVHHAETFQHDNVCVVVGDTESLDQLAPAVAGQDAVIDTVGGKTPWKSTELEQKTAANVITAMQQHGVRRLLAISALGTYDSAANASFLYEHLLAPTYLRGAIADKQNMETAIGASDLDWTIVRPAVLTDGPLTRTTRLFSADSGATAHKISRADVAAWLLDHLTDRQVFGQAFTIATE